MTSLLFLSIVIPVYNASTEIQHCLNSIWTQGLLNDEYEVICVDDCSTDDSCMIIEKEIATHGNLRLVRNEKNRRAGGARNHGVSEAQGEYVLFIDADDYFHSGGLARAMGHLKQNMDLDILVCNFARELPGHPNDVFVHTYSTEEKLTVNGYIARAHIPCGPCQWLFRRSLMIANNIWFREHCICEDVDWTHRLALLAKKVQYQPILLTHYTIGTTTQTALSYATPFNVYAYMMAGNELFKLRNSYEAIGCGRYILVMSQNYIKQGLKYYLAMWDSTTMKISQIHKLVPKELPLNYVGKIVRLHPFLYSWLSNLLVPFVRFALRVKNIWSFRGLRRGGNHA